MVEVKEQLSKALLVDKVDQVGIDGDVYDVVWRTEPGELEDAEGRALFKPKMIHQLILMEDGDVALSFYGNSREQCVDHLARYLVREVAA